MFASCASMHLFRLSGEPKISGFERCARVVCFVISHPRHQFLRNDPVCAGELPFVPKYNSGVGSACLLTCATAETRRQGVATRRGYHVQPMCVVGCECETRLLMSRTLSVHPTACIGITDIFLSRAVCLSECNYEMSPALTRQ